ncbi:MAG TPA: molybdopterin-dependent oxidoreductase [Blastocatellia bacterium]|nr:molybdopterin-dependent oxidoreductase [Blastocatellia bacterium]
MSYINLNLSGGVRTPPSERELDIQAGFLSAALLLALMLIGRFTFHLPLLPDIMADWVFAITPGSIVEAVVTMFGAFAKHLGFIACAIFYLAIITFAGTAFLKQMRGRETGWIAGISYGAVIWSITIAVIPLFGGGLFGRDLWNGAFISSASLLVYHLIYGTALVRLRSAFSAKSDFAERGERFLNRRNALRGVMAVVIAAAAYDILRPVIESIRTAYGGKVRSGSGVFPDITGLSMEITPTRDFYKVSKNSFDPDVDVKRWRLEIGGMVEHPLSLSFEELKSLPAVEEYATLMCISNEVGGNLIGNAKWKGVRLRDLLEKAQLKPGVVDISLRAVDDYTDSIPLDRAMADGTILVYEMNSAPLTAEHGFPVRLLVPGIYGMKNVKWITRLTAVSYDFKGYWQVRGWNDQAIYRTMSRIDIPDGKAKLGNITIAGVSFAGDRGISKVEVSTDSGKNWEAAELKPGLSQFTWVLWEKQWSPPSAGSYNIVVRATDGSGAMQELRNAPPFPDGSAGYHRVGINVI